MYQTYADLLPLMATLLPRCPESERTAELRKAWLELCERTNIWQAIITRDLVLDRKHPLTPSDEALVKKVLKVYVRTAAEVAANRAGALLHPGRYDVVRYPGGVRLEFIEAPIEAVTNGLQVHAVLVPKSGVKECEAPWLLSDYHQALIGRAVYQLAIRPRRPWSSLTIANQGKIDWQNGLTKALRESQTVMKGDQACVRTG